MNNSKVIKVITLLLSFYLISCGGKKADESTKKDGKVETKKENTVKKVVKKVNKDEVLAALNGKLDREEVLLADPDGIYYKPVEKKWEVKDFNFSVYEMAYDQKRAILVGMNKKQTLIKGVNVKTGRVIWRTKLNLTKPEELGEKKSEEGGTEYISLKDTEGGRDNSTPSFAYDGKKMIVIAVNRRNKAKDWLYDLTYFGVDITNGRVKWRRRLQKGNQKWPYPSNWEQLGWTLWSQKGVIYLGEPEKGPLYIIDQRNGEWYDINFPKETDPYKLSFAGTGKDRTYFFKYGKPGFILKAVDKLDGSEDGYGWEVEYPCRLRKAFFIGKEVGDTSTFLCSKKPKDPKAYKLIDTVVHFNPKNGKVVWETEIDKKTPGPQSKRDMIYSKLSKDKKSLYVRSLFYLVKVDLKTGKLLWKWKLNPAKVDAVFVDGQFFNHQWVLGGDEAYDSYIMLNDKNGKKIWSSRNTNATKKNKNPGMPATAYIVENWLVSYGDNVIKIFNKDTGKIIWKHSTKDKIESLYLSNGIFYLETMGIRKGFKVPSFDVWSFDRTKSETLLNNGWMKGLGDELMLHNEDDLTLSKMKPLKSSMKRALPKDKLIKGKILTKKARFNSTEFSKDGKYIYFGTNDRKQEQQFKVEIATKKITKLGEFEKNGYSIISKRGKKELIVAKGKKKTKTVNQYYLKTKDGKEIQLSENELEYYKFDDDNKKIFLVVADNQFYEDEVDYKDLTLKVYDIEKDKFYTFLNIKKAIAKVRRKIKATFVRYGDFGPKETVSFTLENMNSHKGVYTMKYNVKKPLIVVSEVSVDDGELVFDFPAKLNLIPTAGLEFQETDFNHSFYNSLDWGTDKLALGEDYGLKYSKARKNGFEKFEHLITVYSWHPNGVDLAINSGGNIYILNTNTKKVTPITYYLPKREPKNIDDTELGNKYRIISLDYSEDGKKLVIGIKLPKEVLRRIVLIDLP